MHSRCSRPLPSRPDNRRSYCNADWGVDGRIVASKGIFRYDGDRLITTMDVTRTVSESGPIFSPDGLKVVFAKRDKGTPTTDLWTMDADGGNPVQLLDAPGTNEYPEAWRPA